MLKPLPPRPATGVWSTRVLSRLALVIMIEAAAARWFGWIDTPTLLAALAGTLVLCVIGIGFLAAAWTDIWWTGATGFGSTVPAFLALAIVAAPFMGAGVAAVIYPAIDDVSTDLDNRPPFRTRPAPTAAPLGDLASQADYPRLQTAAYPDVVGRLLPLSTVEAQAAARSAINELGWTKTAEAEPAAETEAGWLEATARTLPFGMDHMVAVRITADVGGSRIDVRSASGFPMRDLGENARRIRDFYAKLDEIMKRPAG